MPLPLIKLVIVTIKTFARPFNTILTRRVREQANSYEAHFFKWFGMKVFALETKIDKMINKNSTGGIAIVTVDLEKVSSGAAINRGVEVFLELTMFYGLLICLTFYELRKSMREKKEQMDRLKHVEEE